MSRLVATPEQIDATWLSEALREAGVLPTGRVAEARGRMIGHGKMGDNVRYALRYDGAPEGAPESVVAKLPAADPTARGGSVARGGYLREVRFYQEIAPRVPMRTPRAYAAEIDAAGSDYVILMEDLAPAEPGDQMRGCSASEAEVAVREAARLHAPLANDASLAAREWIAKSTPEGSALGQQLLVQFWPGFLERFRASISLEGEALAERFVHGFAAWAQGYTGPRTLVHADYRVENMLFATPAGGDPVAVVDWQSAMHGCGLIDVAYFLGNGLEPRDRRAHEREFVEGYRKELARFGVELAADACWEQYRRYTLHGVLITVLGCMTSGQEERSDRMFAAMIERHLEHALDLDGGDFLP